MKKTFIFLILGIILLFPLYVIAQDIIVAGEENTDIGLGGYALTPILAAILGIVYRFKPDMDNRWKTVIALLAGAGLGLLTIQYDGLTWDFRTVVDRLLYGFLTVGAGAIGLWATQKTFRPSEPNP